MELLAVIFVDLPPIREICYDKLELSTKQRSVQTPFSLIINYSYKTIRVNAGRKIKSTFAAEELDLFICSE